MNGFCFVSKAVVWSSAEAWVRKSVWWKRGDAREIGARRGKSGEGARPSDEKTGGASRSDGR